MKTKPPPPIVCFETDGSFGQVIIDGKEWRWSFSEFNGPMFYGKNGVELKRQPGSRTKPWAAFEKWLLKLENPA
jgi:hypothetical protein